MKVVFLDIDGVLNSTDSVMVSIGPTIETSEQVHELDQEYGLCVAAKYALKHVNPVAVALLNRLLKETEAQLVLSSSHRTNFLTLGYGSKMHIQALMKFLSAMGIQVPDDWFSITPRLYGERGAEIDGYLCSAEENGIDVDRYVILDDGKDFYPHQPLVHCNADRGFTFKEYQLASTLLGGSTSSIILPS